MKPFYDNVILTIQTIYVYACTTHARSGSVLIEIYPLQNSIGGICTTKEVNLACALIYVYTITYSGCINQQRDALSRSRKGNRWFEQYFDSLPFNPWYIYTPNTLPESQSLCTSTDISMTPKKRKNDDYRVSEPACWLVRGWLQDPEGSNSSFSHTVHILSLHGGYNWSRLIFPNRMASISYEKTSK